MATTVLERKNVLKRKFAQSTNFMTPTQEGIFFNPSCSIGVELSSGDGFDKDENGNYKTMYGVTVARFEKGTLNVEFDREKSKSFHDLQQAKDYISDLTQR